MIMCISLSYILFAYRQRGPQALAAMIRFCFYNSNKCKRKTVFGLPNVVKAVRVGSVFTAIVLYFEKPAYLLYGQMRTLMSVRVHMKREAKCYLLLHIYVFPV